MAIPCCDNTRVRRYHGYCSLLSFTFQLALPVMMVAVLLFLADDVLIHTDLVLLLSDQPKPTFRQQPHNIWRDKLWYIQTVCPTSPALEFLVLSPVRARVHDGGDASSLEISIQPTDQPVCGTFKQGGPQRWD
jgi:hypothetical protein